MNSADSHAQSVPETVLKAYQSGFKLNINRLDTAFIAGVQTYLEVQQEVSLKFSDLEAVFNIVNDLEEGPVDALPQRTQRAIERLVKNRLLIRVDGGGISQQAVFDISALGKAIVAYISQNDRLTRQNLTIITSRIISILAEIRRALASSGTQAFWDEMVLMPLKHVIVELLEAIEKRQRGLDLEQEEVRGQISNLLEKNWLSALESCESLLEATSTTLQELYRSLLIENTAIKQGLNEIYEMADEQRQIQTVELIDNIYLRLDQLEQWGKERVSSWSQYYRRVNDFLQSIVRFDPNRELSQKLKEQIQEYPEKPWCLELIEPLVYRGLREIQYDQEKRRVVRMAPDAASQVVAMDDDGNLVLDLMIEEIKRALDLGEMLNLAEILKPFLENHPLEKVYPHVGTLIDLMLKEIKQRPEADTSWVKPVAALHFEIQNLIIAHQQQ